MGWQGSHMLPAWRGAGHQPPQQPDAPEPVCGSKAFPSGDTATWPSPAQLQSQGFQRCVSKGPGCTVFLAQGFWPGRDIWPASTPQPRQPWPLGTQGQGEPERGKGHALLCARQVTECPWHGPPGIALTSEASQGQPPGPCYCQAPSARMYLLKLRGERRKGHGGRCHAGGRGRRAVPAPAQDVPPGLAEASSPLCTSWIYRLGKGRSLREFPFIAGTPRLREGTERMYVCSAGPGLRSAPQRQPARHGRWRWEAPFSSSG